MSLVKDSENPDGHLLLCHMIALLAVSGSTCPVLILFRQLVNYGTFLGLEAA